MKTKIIIAICLMLFGITTLKAQGEAEFQKADAAFQANNFTEAFNWIKQAAEKGHIKAMNNTGVLYDNGQGVAQNHAEALKWYKKAAEKGYADAMYNVGVFYEKGEGVLSKIIPKPLAGIKKPQTKDTPKPGKHYLELLLK